jgi:PAS domain-containing protein
MRGFLQAFCIQFNILPIIRARDRKDGISMDETFATSNSGVWPFGFGLLQLITDSDGKAEDYIFLDMDPAFEKLTGLRREEALNKKASELFGGRNPVAFDWLSYYGSIMRSQRTQETSQWVEELGRYLKITAIPSDGLRLVVILREASKESLPTRQKSDDPILDDLEAVFNSTHDAMLLIEYRNGEFRNIRNNAMHQRLTGYSHIEGTSAIDLLGEEVGQKLMAYYAQCMRTGRPITYEQTYNFAPVKGSGTRKSRRYSAVTGFVTCSAAARISQTSRPYKTKMSFCSTACSPCSINTPPSC